MENKATINHKQEAKKLANEHNITIDFVSSTSYSLSILPGHQLSANDDRTGLSGSGEDVTSAELWQAVYEDICSLVESKAEWAKIPGFDEGTYAANYKRSIENEEERA